MAEIIFSKYSNERSRRFAVRTDILEENKKRWLLKTALYPEGEEHVKNLIKWNQKLDQQYKQISYECNKCQETSEGVRLEYLEARSLSEYLDSLLQAGETEAASGKLMKFLEQVKLVHSQKPFEMTEEFQQVFGKVALPENLTCAPLTNIDIICDNVMLTEPVTLLDYEWTFEFPVPCEYVLYRIIHYYIRTHSMREILEVELFYRKFGISRTMRESFEQMEKGFQNYITGNHVPMREMYGMMTPGMDFLSVESTGVLQVYFGDEEGRYYEQFSVKRPIMSRHADYTIDLPSDCRKVRIDPGDNACTVQIKELSFDGREASFEGVEVPDGILYGNWAFISRHDPHIKNITVPHGAKKLTIKMEIHLESNDMLDCVRNLQNEIVKQKNETIRVKELMEEQARDFAEKSKPKIQVVYEKVMKKRGK